MLVKFLSFVASILGTQRYKTILLSCFALVLSLTGVTAMAVFRDSTPSDKAAASTVDKSDSDAKTESNSPQLGNSKQNTKDTATGGNSDSQSQSSNNQTQGGGSSDSANGSQQDSTAAATDVTVNSTTVSVNAGATTDSPTISASTTDKSTVTWSVSIDDNASKYIRTVNATQSSAATFSFQLQADKDAPKDKPTKITLVARDASRNIVISKTITVNIQ